MNARLQVRLAKPRPQTWFGALADLCFCLGVLALYGAGAAVLFGGWTVSAGKGDTTAPRFIDVLLRENPEIVTVDGRPASAPSAVAELVEAVLAGTPVRHPLAVSDGLWFGPNRAERLRNAIARIGGAVWPCDECDGKGERENRFGRMDACDACDGTGRIGAQP